jgi:hypothetical protein
MSAPSCRGHDHKTPRPKAHFKTRHTTLDTTDHLWIHFDWAKPAQFRHCHSSIRSNQVFILSRRPWPDRTLFCSLVVLSLNNSTHSYTFIWTSQLLPYWRSILQYISAVFTPSEHKNLKSARSSHIGNNLSRLIPCEALMSNPISWHVKYYANTAATLIAQKTLTAVTRK